MKKKMIDKYMSFLNKAEEYRKSGSIFLYYKLRYTLYSMRKSIEKTKVITPENLVNLYWIIKNGVIKHSNAVKIDTVSYDIDLSDGKCGIHFDSDKIGFDVEIYDVKDGIDIRYFYRSDKNIESYQYTLKELTKNTSSYEYPKNEQLNFVFMMLRTILAAQIGLIMKTELVYYT